MYLKKYNSPIYFNSMLEILSACNEKSVLMLKNKDMYLC